MGLTNITNKQVKDGGIFREDLNSDIAGKAVIKKIVIGQAVLVGFTGADAGTGDVTIGVNIETANLKFVVVSENPSAISKLDTIQNIATTASPTFAGLTLANSLEFGVDDGICAVAKAEDEIIIGSVAGDFALVAKAGDFLFSNDAGSSISLRINTSGDLIAAGALTATALNASNATLTGTNNYLRINASTFNTFSNVEFRQNNTVKGSFGLSHSTNGLISGSASGDLCIRADGGKIRFSNNSGTNTQALFDGGVLQAAGYKSSAGNAGATFNSAEIAITDVNSIIHNFSFENGLLISYSTSE